MATNELLPFATGAGANIQTQAEYAADAQRSSGNIPGVARSALVNKAIRQSSFAASMIGQFIADQGGINVVDDGDVAGLKTDFIASIRAYLQTQVATTAQAQAQTENTLLLTPLRLADSFKGANQVLSGNGRQNLPGGVKLQWGSISITTVSGSGSLATAVFSQAYTSWRQVVLLERSNTNTIQYKAYDNDSALLTGIQINLVAVGGAGGIPVPVQYIAVGV